MENIFGDVLPHFKIEDRYRTVLPLGSGLINDTYCVKADPASTPKYLLQRVNHHIFKDVPALMRNIAHVTSHISKKLGLSEEHGAATEVLKLVPAKNDELFYLDSSGNYWRLFHFLGNTRSFDKVESELQAHQGGYAFGRFQLLLSDIDTSLIQDSIPNFHNISMRLNALRLAISKDPRQRVASLEKEIAFVTERELQMKKILNWGAEGLLPGRVIHGDTKFNNILFDQQGRVQCVVDLDTVMVGYPAYDFGDAIRTIINSAAEDEKNPDNIQLNIPLFEAYTRGYLSEAIGFLQQAELNSLIEGVLLLPYMQAVRFLTDYIEGDVYYKTAFAEHNLQRTLAQMQLLRKLEEKREVLAGIIEAEAERCRARLK